MTFDDIVFGEIKNSTFEVEGDPILIKSDGYPTYHLVSSGSGSTNFIRCREKGATKKVLNLKIGF